MVFYIFSCPPFPGTSGNQRQPSPNTSNEEKTQARWSQLLWIEKWNSKWGKRWMVSNCDPFCAPDSIWLSCLTSGSCVRKEVQHDVFSQQMKCSEFASGQDTTRARSCTFKEAKGLHTLCNLRPNRKKTEPRWRKLSLKDWQKLSWHRKAAAQKLRFGATSAQLSLLGENFKTVSTCNPLILAMSIDLQSWKVWMERINSTVPIGKDGKRDA